jgi:hypothetical protein
MPEATKKMIVLSLFFPAKPQKTPRASSRAGPEPEVNPVLQKNIPDYSNSLVKKHATPLYNMAWKSLTGVTYLANAQIECPQGQILHSLVFQHQGPMS